MDAPVEPDQRDDPELHDWDQKRSIRPKQRNTVASTTRLRRAVRRALPKWSTTLMARKRRRSGWPKVRFKKKFPFISFGSRGPRGGPSERRHKNRYGGWGRKRGHIPEIRATLRRAVKHVRVGHCNQALAAYHHAIDLINNMGSPKGRGVRAS